MNDLDLLAPLGNVDPPDESTMREVAALLAVEPGTRKPAPRRALFIGGGAVAAAVAIAAVVTLIGQLVEPATAPPGAAAKPSTPDASGAATIQGYALTAFDSSELIMHEFRTDRSPDDPSTYTYEFWISTPYPKVGENYTMRGRLAKNGAFDQDYADTYRVPAPGTPAPAGCPGDAPASMGMFEVRASSTVVDYLKHTWTRAPVECFGTGIDDQASVRQQIAAGKWQRVPGEQTINGRTVVELTATEPVPVTLWVDAGSYLPVRSEVHLGDGTETTDFDFLPNTAPNRALLTPPIPAGFTETH